MHVDVLHFNGVVAVAEAVPWRYFWLGVAGGVGGAGAQGVTADGGLVPFEGPVLPLVWRARRLEFGRVPFAFAGEADLDAGHRAGARPGFPAHDAGPGADARARSRLCDASTPPHQGHRLPVPVGMLRPVRIGLKFPL